MTATRIVERNIVSQLIHGQRNRPPFSLAERLISGLAVAAVLGLLLLQLQGLAWVALGCALVFGLGLR